MAYRYKDDFQNRRKKFFQFDYKSNNMKDIDENSIIKIDEAIENFKKNYLAFKNYTFHINPNAAIYSDMLSYLIARKEFTFDEKMLFIIRYFDKDLYIANLYLNTATIDNHEIEEEDSSYVQQELRELQESEKAEYISNVKKVVGVYDAYILKYELKLYKKKNDELRFDIKKNYIETFFHDFIGRNIDLTISDEELEDIIKLAHEYKEKYGIPSLNDLAFQLIEQTRTIGVKTKKSAIIFMIYVIDENFELFKVYDACGDWHQIKDKCDKELGLFNKQLILNEVKFDKSNNTHISSYQ